VQQIVGKWAKSKKVGQLNGAATAAVNNAKQASTNTDDAVKRANALGAKVGLKGEVPVAVASAAKVAGKASDAATAAATKLKTTSDTFSGKFGNFAKAITDDDMVKIAKETEEAMVAAEDASEAAERVLKKADGAKDAAMKNSKGALALINGLIADTTKLSTGAGEAGQRSGEAVKDVGALVKKSKAAATKLDGKIKKAKEQAPVWEAYKADLEGRQKAAEDSAKEVTDAVKALNTADGDMDKQTKTLQGVADKAQSSQNAALGQTKNIGDTEESIRKTEAALLALKGKVGSMIKDTGRLADKLAETDKRLGA